ncbi:MAG: alpha/beta hydrolase [Anaerolineales bacterium]
MPVFLCAAAQIGYTPSDFQTFPGEIMDSLTLGSGQTLNFLHANGYPPRAYLPLLRRLAENYQVQAPLQRPLWPGSEPKSFHDWNPLSEDFLRFLEESGQRAPVMAVGHSMGGIAILRAALRQPQRFRALILLDPVLFPPATIYAWRLIHFLGLGHRFHPLIGAAQKRRREFDDLERLFRGYRRKATFRYLDDEALRAYVEAIACPNAAGGYRLCYSPEWEVKIYESGVSPDMELWRGLKTLKIPTLIVRGAETDTFLPAAARRVQRLNPAIQIISVARSTHLVPLEQPQAVAEAMRDFLAGL